MQQPVWAVTSAVNPEDQEIIISVGEGRAISKASDPPPQK